MRICRFIDHKNHYHYGVPNTKLTQAELLDGDIYTDAELTGQTVEIAQLLSPVVPPNIFCIGLNYREHATETGADLPDHPIVFMKPTSALNHPNSPIPIPASCEHGPEVDYEAELAVVIGKAATNVREEDALSYVRGYTCANDISARRWQKHAGGGQWIRGKGFNGFCPLGPVLVTADDIPDPQKLDIKSRLNGQLMQNSNTEDMIFSVAQLISLLSRDTTLLPGTVILTGTPSGVGVARTPPIFLQPEDRIEVEIDHIGTLSNPISTPPT